MMRAGYDRSVVCLQDWLWTGQPRALRTSPHRPGDAGLLQDLGPAHGLRRDEAVELLRRALAERNELKIDQLLLHVRLGDRGMDRAVELGADILQDAARHRHRLPGRPVEAWNAGLGERRQLRRRDRAARS